MRQKITQLRNTMHTFVLGHSIDEIPEHCYENAASHWTKMIEKGHEWDRYKAAAKLLDASVNGGYINESQLTPNGNKAIAWAKNTIKTADS